MAAAASSAAERPPFDALDLEIAVAAPRACSPLPTAKSSISGIAEILDFATSEARWVPHWRLRATLPRCENRKPGETPVASADEVGLNLAESAAPPELYVRDITLVSTRKLPLASRLAKTFEPMGCPPTRGHPIVL